ncbi:hypothetical protein BDZ91DRAFT_846978 [Kalaharituber pfeilii]|nr:hypothetical protein BDZ91DRAFT_846978 [Kalaharituber pfeilii]
MPAENSPPQPPLPLPQITNPYPNAPRLGLHYPTDALVSSPINLSKSLDSVTGSIRGKAVLITGGASGIGEAVVKKLVVLGAKVAVGDINDARGKALVEACDKLKGDKGGSVNFFHCDVASYDSQAQFFLDAIKWAGGALHCVIVNAAVAEIGVLMEEQEFVPDKPPTPPDLTTFDINYRGALFTIRLAHHFLRHNSSPHDPTPPDRHILLMGSYACFLDSPIIPLYAAAKHGLLGLFASIRVTSLTHNRIRFNLIAPYFVATPLMPNSIKLVMAGQQMVKLDHVVDGIVRLVGDEEIMGRVLAVGPCGVAEDVEVGGGLEDVETFSRRVVKVLNGMYWGGVWWERWGRIVRDVIAVLVVWIGMWVAAKLRK